MTTWRNRKKRSLHALSAALVSTAAAAQNTPETWTCKPCDAATGWDADIKTASARASDDAYRFGNGTGLDDNGWFLFGDFSGRYVGSDALYFDYEGYARGSEANGLFLRGGKQGTYRLRGKYQSIPGRRFGDALTPFRGSGSGELMLPESWVRAGNTADAIAAFGRLRSKYRGSWIDRVAAERLKTIRD